MDLNASFPRKIKIDDNTFISPSDKCFVIAELGQNHQGDLSIAKKMILAAKESGADCVKFQKSHLPSKFNKAALLRPYSGSNSWGITYGAHKEFLEFTEEEFIELQSFSKKNKILFSSSVMDDVSLSFLYSLNVPYIKIGSGDFHNIWLLKKAAKLGKPLLISTGMSSINEVLNVYNTLKTENSDFCFLHCISSYPVPLKEINLNVIREYKKLFPDINIGYSGHEFGIEIPLAAVALGAKIIEKHFTLDKSWKGSDHICSLTPPEFKSMVSNIRKFESGLIDPNVILNEETVRKALGSYEKKFQCSETQCFKKLGKTVVAATELNKGDVITWENICLKVAEPKGVHGKDVEEAIGKTLKRNVKFDESILYDDLYN